MLLLSPFVSLLLCHITAIGHMTIFAEIADGIKFFDAQFAFAFPYIIAGSRVIPKFQRFLIAVFPFCGTAVLRRLRYSYFIRVVGASFALTT